MTTLAQQRGEPDAIELTAALALAPVRDLALFMIDGNGRIASWNEGVQQILGWNREDWIGQPMQVVFTPEDVQAGVPQAEWAKAAAVGFADDPRWMLRKGGSRFWALGSLTRLQDADGRTLGFLKALRDGSAKHQIASAVLLREQAQARADQFEGALIALLHAVDDGVLFTDAHGIRRCNAAALSLLGAASLDALQIDAPRWVQRFALRREREGPLLAEADTPMQMALAGRRDVHELWATNAASGVDVFLRCVAAPVTVGGRVAGSVVVFSDLDEQQQLRQKRHDLTRVQDVLHERDAELRALVDGVRDYAIYTLDVAGRILSWHPGAQARRR